MADSLFFKSISLPICFVCLSASPLAAAPVTQIYEITSGTYTEVGGFVGVWTRDLPAFDQAFIELTTDAELNTAEMQILGEDLRPFENSFFGTQFTEGVLDGSLILFRRTIFTPFFNEPGELDYTILLDGDVLNLQGELSWNPPGFDIPSLFEHAGVEAVLVPEPETLLLLVFGLAIFIRRSA